MKWSCRKAHYIHPDLTFDISTRYRGDRIRRGQNSKAKV